MPTPREDESRDEFMERCIPIVLDDGTAGDQEQAVAVCSSMWEQAQEGEKERMIRKTVPIKIERKGKSGGRIVISTGELDRDRDRVLPQGARIDNYLKNPVVQWGHNYQDPWATIGKTTKLEISPDGLVAEFELRPPANEHDPQNIILLLWQGEWIRAASIGFDPTVGGGGDEILLEAAPSFIPRAWTENDQGGLDYTEWDLLEWSLVPIGANQSALRMAVKALGDKEPDDDTHPLAAQFIKAVEKRGRVLSAANESKLRRASDLLREVLAQVEEIVEDEGKTLAQKPPEPKSAENTDSLPAEQPQNGTEHDTAEPAVKSHAEHTQPDTDADVLEMLGMFLDKIEDSMR